MTFKATAHGNNFLNTGKCFFILLDQSGKIGHRCQFDYGYFLFFQYISQKIHSTDLLLMGRNSYDIVRTFPEWPYGDKPVVVLTHRPAEPRPHVSFRQGALAQVLGELWQEGARHIYLDGGEVVRQGLQAGLVDELTLFWVPVTLGRGVSLFAGTLPGRLTPVSSVVLPSGLVRVVYHPV